MEIHRYIPIHPPEQTQIDVMQESMWHGFQITVSVERLHVSLLMFTKSIICLHYKRRIFSINVSSFSFTRLCTKGEKDI